MPHQTTDLFVVSELDVSFVVVINNRQWLLGIFGSTLLHAVTFSLHS